MSRLKTFHLRGLNKSLHLQTTFVDRRNANSEVLRRAELFLHADTQNANERKIYKAIETTLEEQRIRLTGNILRAEASDPVRQVSFRPGTAIPYQVARRRVGGPRQQWLEQFFNLICNKLNNGQN